ncbi:MAG: helix-turn-helix domain-containing protein [Patescibacteria group bacterium]|nr:helix-turn-helix domain-containing protein [Patescibacteria group bacterium]
MSETANLSLNGDLELLNLKEVANFLRLSQISIHRLIARNVLPVYRVCRKLLFKKKDVLECLEKSKRDAGYGSQKD